MLGIDPIKKTTITEQIMEKIAVLITSGKLKPGAKLPNERDLSEQFGVNRGRVREALRALSLIGLVTIKSGEGTFVTKKEVPIPPQTIIWMFHNEKKNLNEIYAARRLIESEVYFLAAKQATNTDIHDLEAFIRQLANVQNDESDRPKFQNLVDQFDFFMGKICGNDIYYKLMQTFVYLRRESMLKLLNVPGAMENSLEKRAQLVEAIKAQDEEKIRTAIEQIFVSAQDFYDSIIS